VGAAQERKFSFSRYNYTTNVVGLSIGQNVSKATSCNQKQSDHEDLYLKPDMPLRYLFIYLNTYFVCQSTQPIEPPWCLYKII